MNAKQSPDTPESWGIASRGYAEKVAPHLMEAFSEHFVDRLGPGPDDVALEVGAGSGALTAMLAPRVKSLLATDFAPLMIELVRERMRDAGAPNVVCKVMDGQALELEDSTFDAAACSFCLMLFPDRAKGFSELARVLRPGGRAMVSGWAGPDRFEAFGLFLAGLKRAFPDMPPPPAPPPVFSLADPDDFRTQMEGGGFEDVEIELVTRELEIPDFNALWGMLTVGAPPVQALFDRVGPAGRDKLRDTMEAMTEERFGSGPIRLSNTATLGVGVAS